MIKSKLDRLLGVLFFTVALWGCQGGNGEFTAASLPGNGGNPPAPPVVPPGSNGNFPIAFDVGLTYSRDLYVNAGASPGGNGSVGAPFQTIGAAVAQATPGTRIRISAGTYGAIGSFSNVQGLATAPIALIAEGTVIVDTGRTGLALQLTDPRYVVLQGITIQNTAPHGINIDDGGSYATPGEYVVLRGMTFRNIGTGGNNDCLKLSGINRFYLEGNTFTGCNQGEAIDMVGCHNGVISGNLFYDLPVNGIQTKGGSADVLIHGNRFINISQRSINAGGSTGAQYYRPSNTSHEALRIQMIANIFERTGSTPVAFVGCGDCVFSNNTVTQPGTYLARILEENVTLGPGSGGYFINNIIMLNTNARGAVVNVGSGTQPSSFTFGSNLWYSLDNPSYTGPVLGGGVPAESGSLVQQNPLLDANLRPQAGSPALNAGRAVPGGLAGDFDRAAYSSPPALGAFSGP